MAEHKAAPKLDQLSLVLRQSERVMMIEKEVVY
jgi:hypothetical protein